MSLLGVSRRDSAGKLHRSWWFLFFFKFLFSLNLSISVRINQTCQVDKMFGKCCVSGFLFHFNWTGANMQFTGFQTVLGYLKDQHTCQSSSIKLWYLAVFTRWNQHFSCLFCLQLVHRVFNISQQLCACAKVKFRVETKKGGLLGSVFVACCKSC